MSLTSSCLSKTQQEIQNLETFLVNLEKMGGSLPAVQQTVQRMEILLHTGIDLALAAAVVLRRGKMFGQQKKMRIKLVVEP